MSAPSIKISLQDKSSFNEAPSFGRSAFVVILSNKGQHNRVYNLANINQLIDEFGQPAIDKTGPGHYMAAAALSATNSVNVVRPVLLDNPNPAKNQAIANNTIYVNDENGIVNTRYGNFAFTNEDDAGNNFGANEFVSQYVFCNFVGFQNIDVGEYIYSDEDDLTKKLEVIEKGKLNNVGDDEIGYVYYLKLDEKYQGKSSINEDVDDSLLVSLKEGLTDFSDIQNYTCDLTTEYSNKCSVFNPGVITRNNVMLKFSSGSNIAVADGEVSYNNINRGEWIYPVSGEIDNIVQVSNKFYDEISCEYKIILNQPYIGLCDANHENVRSFEQFYNQSSKFIKAEEDIPVNDSIWSFYATGTGSYYNQIFIRANRNTTLEKMYVDDDGQPKYKYAFIDLSIYGENEDGTIKLLEGPWQCSVVNEIDGGLAKNIYTGRELYITKIVNANSRIVKMKDGELSNILEGYGDDKAKLRLDVLSLFADNYVNDTDTFGKNGFYLDNGYDGQLYDKWGRINLNDFDIQNMIANVYKGTFKSTDGSIEILAETKNNRLNFDYVITGGYNINIQQAGRTLVETREDCMLLADTGGMSLSAKEDIDIKTKQMNWNSLNAAIYTQYREIYDPFSGKKFWISPVYHAITKHLQSDMKGMAIPVAGITNGSISNVSKLAYRPSSSDMDALVDAGLNPTVIDGNTAYIATQVTTLNKLSILQRIHAAKTLQYIRTIVPPLLKPLLQVNPNAYWMNYGQSMLDSQLRQFTNKNSNRYALDSYSASLGFDPDNFKLNVNISLKFPRVIESIDISIVVE